MYANDVFLFSCDLQFVPRCHVNIAGMHQQVYWSCAVCRALEVPVTEHTYEDGEILSHVINFGLPPSSTLVNAHLFFRKSGYVYSYCQERQINMHLLKH